jgi:phosphohistidine phosphatase
MSRELLILRHAKSSWDSGARTDFQRPLAPRGLRDAPRVGAFLARQGLKPDFVVSSPAERARETVVAALRAFGMGTDDIHWDTRIYHASPHALVEVLSESPDDARRVLIAGHNPGLEYLLLHLCGPGLTIPDDGKLMPTAAVAHLEIAVPWRDLGRATARLLSLTRARSLPAD